MAAKDTLQSGIEALNAEMSTKEDKAEADKYYAEQLAKLIDEHAKSLVAELTAAAVVSLGLTAGGYPVILVSPTTANLKIKDSL